MTPAPDKTGAIESGLIKPGTEVLGGRFRVLELLGRGGMGDVYLGEQVSLGRKVALKTLRNELSAQPGMTERFKREALLLSQVDHPSVVRVIDFGQAELTYVLVMEYVEGENLAMAAREGPFAPDRAVRVLTDIAEGLEAIHARGIVHRDLKLDNVLLTQTGSTERARLLDFGIARFAEAESGPGGSVTQAGLVLGTPEYISPEQATGGKIDARANVYAFGVLAYRLLAGRHPFEGPGAREFFLQHISQEPPPVRTFAPQLSDPLASLVMACLAKAPAGRPDGGKGLLAALAGLDKAAAVTQPATPPPVTAPTAVARPPSGVVAAPAAAVAPGAAQALEVVRKTGEHLLKLPRRTRWVAAGVAGAVLLLAFALSRLSTDPAVAKAAELLDQGRPAQALEVINAAQGRNEGALRMLRAEALHQQQHHSEEWSLVALTPEDGLSKMRPALLAALMTDYPKNDDDEGLRAALARLPKAQLREVRQWAKGSWSQAQWGALRWADSEHLDGTDLVTGYLKVLESTDCEALATAARRLGELGDTRAVEPLKRLAAQPRRQVLIFTRSCGEDEAASALRKLGASPDEPR